MKHLRVPGLGCRDLEKRKGSLGHEVIPLAQKQSSTFLESATPLILEHFGNGGGEGLSDSVMIKSIKMET